MNLANTVRYTLDACLISKPSIREIVWCHHAQWTSGSFKECHTPCRFLRDSSLIRSDGSEERRATSADFNGLIACRLALTKRALRGMKKVSNMSKSFYGDKRFFLSTSARTNVRPFTRIILVKWFIVTTEAGIFKPSYLPAMLFLSPFFINTFRNQFKNSNFIVFN